MTISLKEKGWFMGKEEMMRIIRPQEEIEWDRSSRVIFHTPNLVEKITQSTDGETSMFYLREGIDLRRSRGFGGETRYVWSKGSDVEDQRYEETGLTLLRHPLVGHEMAVYFGEQYPGIHRELLHQGFRVEKVPVGRGKTKFVTTNARYIKAVVAEGLRRNIYPGDENTPTKVTVRILEGEYAGQEKEVSDDTLRVIVDSEEAKTQLSEIVERVGKDPKRQSSLSNSERAMFFAMGIADAYILWWLWNYGLAHDGEIDNNELVLTDYELQEIVDESYASGFVEGLESGDPIEIVIDNEGNIEPDQGDGFETEVDTHNGGTDTGNWDVGPDNSDYDSGDTSD